MKKIILLLIFVCSLSVAGFSPVPYPMLEITLPEPIRPYERIWRATCAIESGNNPRAYNSREKATGIAQIRPIKLSDYNQRMGKGYILYDCYDPEISQEIFFFYATQYHYSDILGICKEWNGRGPKHKEYYKKIKKQLSIMK